VKRNETVGLVPVILVVMVLGMACPLRAGQAEDARNLAEQAIVMFKEQGIEAVVNAINDKNGPFVKGDLYVFALTMENVMLGHPHEYSLRRVKVSKVIDSNGIPIFQKLKEVVERDGSGWVEYMWAKPGQKGPWAKRSFVKRVPGEDLYVGCGFYAETPVARFLNSR
jgi:hypothetical protein